MAPKAAAVKSSAKSSMPPMPDPKLAADADPATKKQRTYTPEEKQTHNAHTLMKRMAEGKVAKASAENVADAKIALDVYKGLTKDDRLEFAKKVEASKGTKQYNWVRTFTESLRAQKRIAEGVIENYYTRTLMCDSRHLNSIS